MSRPRRNVNQTSTKVASDIPSPMTSAPLAERQFEPQHEICDDLLGADFRRWEDHSHDPSAMAAVPAPSFAVRGSSRTGRHETHSGNLHGRHPCSTRSHSHSPREHETARTRAGGPPRRPAHVAARRLDHVGRFAPSRATRSSESPARSTQRQPRHLRYDHGTRI